ncbi:hypothetical protein BOTNAR_0932g00020 [Botryotinia narcissicola]|uniref:Uncharacterized protein n=1 Tax=Botryotinia narcissicola TaxID=278944 RepID=A0A4Z1H4P4_9HELO|nr:hypothetical protein BOTNAR_0932g00020 [Botryotinia narcissicola]
MLSRPIQRSDKRSQNTIKVVAGQPDISSKARLRGRGNLSGYNLGNNLLEWHELPNHSKRVNALGNQLDYLGVVILMWGSTIPTVYYGFYCDPAIQETYWTMISLSGAACAVTTLHPKFRHSAFRPYRAIMYSCLGLSSITFVIHGLMLYGYETQNWRMSLDWLGIMAGFNLFGAFAYAARIPEKWFPRRHDILG